MIKAKSNGLLSVWQKKDNIAYAILACAITITFAYAFKDYIWGNQYFIFKDAASDCQDQYYPMYIYLIEQIKENKLTLWNNYWGLGSETFTNQMWLMDPFAVFIVLGGCLLGSANVPTLILLAHFLKIVLSALLAYQYLRFFPLQKSIRIMGAYVYGFNGFLMVWGQHYWFGAASVYIVILLIIIEKWKNDDKSKKWLLLYSLCVAMVVLYSVYVAYMALIMSTVYACLRFIFVRRQSGKSLVVECVRSGGGFLLATALGMLMGSVMILPFVDINMGISSRITTESLWERMIKNLLQPYEVIYYFKMLLRMISSNCMGINNLGGDYYGLPALSISVVGIPIMAEGLISIFGVRRSKRERAVVVISLLLVLFLLFVPLGSSIFNAMQFPFGRYTFVILPIFTVVFSLGLQRVCIEKKMSYGISGLATFSVVTLVAASAFVMENTEAIRSYDKLLILGNVVTFLLLFLISKSRKSIWVYALFLLIVAGTLVENGITNGNRETVDKVVNETDTDTMQVIRDLKSTDNNFFRIEKTYHDFTPWNDSLLEGYAPSSGYNSNLGKYTDLFYREMWPEITNNGETRVTYAGDYVKEGGKAEKNPVLTLLGVKYILSKEEIEDPGDYYEKLKIAGSDIQVYRNLRANSIITGYDKVITESTFERLPQEDRHIAIGEYLILEDEKALKSQYYTERVDLYNGKEKRAAPYNLELIKDTYFRGNVSVEKDRMLLFAIPYREGWHIYIDGKATETYRADYGFIACQIDSGEHVIEVRYENRVYLMGMIFSGGGILIWLTLVEVCYAKKFIRSRMRNIA